MIDARFRPITTWPRARTAVDARVNPAFTVTFNASLDRLEKELKHLKATDIVIESGHDSRHIRNDGWPRSGSPDPGDPGVILSFTSIHGALRLPSDRFRHWQTMTVEQAALVIAGFGDTLRDYILDSSDAYRTAVRKAMARTHPDVAKDSQAWGAVSRAKAVLDAHHGIAKNAGGA